MRVKAVINRRAGMALGLDLERLLQSTLSAFQAAGHEISAGLAQPAAIETEFDAAVASRPDVLIAGGGDGTVRCAASRVLATEIALAILPLGTVNRLARDLHMPLDLDEALRALIDGDVRRIDVAEVNGRVFLCNSLIGLPPKISEERQHLRGRSLSARIGGYFKLLRTILRSHKRIELSVNDEKSARRVRVVSLAVSNNLYSHEPTLVFGRQALDGGVLGVYLAKTRSGLGLIWLLARAALGLWSGDARLESRFAKTVTIESRRKSIRLSNDGEVEILEMPLSYRIRPKALKMLAPRVRQR
jgi:diacylglycerol kinase family enzyme